MPFLFAENKCKHLEMNSEQKKTKRERKLKKKLALDPKWLREYFSHKKPPKSLKSRI